MMTQSAKHTQGPWRISGVGNKSRTIFRATDTSVYPVADLTADSLNRYGAGDLDANAHLIAAAPEMYAALQKFVHAAIEKHQDIYVADEVIKDPSYLRKYASDYDFAWPQYIYEGVDALAKAMGAA